MFLKRMLLKTTLTLRISSSALGVRNIETIVQRTWVVIMEYPVRHIEDIPNGQVKTGPRFAQATRQFS